MKNNFAIVGAGIATVLICMLDFLFRLGTEVDTNKAQELPTVKASVNVAFLSGSTEEKIEQLLSKYDVLEKKIEEKNTQPNKPVKPKVILMSADQQNLQSGKLTGLFDGEDEYKLIATFFNSQKRFALLKKTHLPSNKVIQIRVDEGELLSGYRLEKVNTDFILFIKQNREIQLQLFPRKAKI